MKSVKYRVVISPEAQTAIDRDLIYARGRASAEIADRWFNGLIVALGSLSEMPTRCARIPEEWSRGIGLRQLLYGGQHHERRIIFVVQAETVQVISYQHGRRTPRLDLHDGTR